MKSTRTIGRLAQQTALTNNRSRTAAWLFSPSYRSLRRPFLLLLFLAGLFIPPAQAQVAEVELVIDWPSWSGENRFSLVNTDGITIATYCDPSYCYNGWNRSYSATVNIGYLLAGEYTLVSYDRYGNEWDDGGEVTIRVSGMDVLTYSHPDGSVVGSPVPFTIAEDPTVATSAVAMDVDWPCYAGENVVQLYNPEGVLLYRYCAPGACLDGSNTTVNNLVDIGCLADASGYYMVGYDTDWNDWGCGGTVQIQSSGSVVNTFTVDGYYELSSSFSVSGGGGSCTGCNPDFAVEAPGTWSGSTAGANDDVDVTGLDGDDRVYAVDIPCDGDWKFSLCSSGYDTKIEITDACGEAPLSGGYNDDACGVQSEVTMDGLAAGTYYVTVDGLNGASGAYTLEVSNATPAAIECPDNVVLGNDAASCTAYVNYLPPWSDSSQAGNYYGGIIPHAPISGNGTELNLADDQMAGPFSIGFAFEYYGEAYTDFYISSNGFISFSGDDEGCCSGQAMPNAGMPNNLIAFAWEDLNPAAGGDVQYFVHGTAPNRVLVVEFDDVPHYNGPTKRVTAQVHLYESSHVVDIHTTEMQSDGGAHTMGLENAAGTSATFVLGRNAANWSASNEAIRFIPPNNASIGCSGGVVTQLAGLGFTADFPVGTTTETYRIDDGNGNTATCSFTVTVNDEEVPTTVDCPDAPLSAIGDQPDCGGAAVSFDVEFADNCASGGIAGTLIKGYASGAVFPVGTTNVEFEYVDAGGNRGTCVFDVQVAKTAEGLSSSLDPVMGCGVCALSDGDSVTVYDQAGAFIGSLEDGLSSPVALGSVQLCNLPSDVLDVDDDAGVSVPILERYWRVDPTTDGPATATLHFLTDEYNNLRTHPDAVGVYAIASPEDIGFTAYPVGEGPATGSVHGEALTVLSIADNGDGTFSAEVSLSNGADIYAHAANPYGGPLPVELIDFRGTRTEAGIALEWITGTERNVSHFAVERSLDGQQFREVGRVDAVGQSTSLQAYDWLDAEVGQGAWYYRLRSVDLDGSTEYSGIIYLDGGQAALPPSALLYPNPFAERSRLRWHQTQAGPISIQVFSLTGAVVWATEGETEAGINQFTLDLDGLEAGTYLVRLVLPDGESVTRQAVKMR